MRIRFVGHASVVAEVGDVVLLMDPWLVGDAFNESWSLWPAPALPDETLARVTHLWVSHEHPDHLSVPTLQSISPERRARITVLFQRHWQPEVAAFLRTLGFAAVIELTHADPWRLGIGVEVTLYQVGHEDSALLVRGNGKALLNLNDCKPSEPALRRLAAMAGQVDVLLDQFSLAGWPGNADDPERIARAAKTSLETFRIHVGLVSPVWALPFASFVRFSHTENVSMNAGINRVAGAIESIEPSQGVVLYPGDVWEVDQPFSGTRHALERYEAAYGALAHQPLRRHPSEPVEKVEAAARSWLEDIRASYHTKVLRRLRPLTFAMEDVACNLTMDIANNAISTHPADGASTIVHLSSQAAWYTFAHRWGVATLLISGRFRLTGPEPPFRRFKQLGSAYSTGIDTKHLVQTIATRRLAGVVWSRRREVARELINRVR